MFRRQSLALVVALFSSQVFAQEVEIQADENGASVRMPGLNADVRVANEPAQAPAPRPTAAPMPPPSRVVGAESFEIAYPHAAGESRLRLMSPEAARADVWSEREFIGSYDLPTSIRLRDQRFYRVIISQGDVVLFDRKVELRQFLDTVVSMRALPTQPRVIAPAPRAATMADFESLLAAVKAESFSDSKLDIIRSSVGALTIDQVGLLVDELPHSSDKVAAVAAVRSRVIDPQNALRLNSHFTFDGDKKAVRDLFR